MSKEGFKPEVFNTIGPKLKAHFEKYNGDAGFENGEPDFDEIREEIAKHYGVPFTEEKESAPGGENHLFIVDNKMVENQRHARAFSVIRRTEGDKTDAWYIDARQPHAVMLRRLYNYYHVPDDDQNEVINGFLDTEGFPEIETIQEKTKELGKPITWFVKEVSSPSPILE
jgi:hypothetical protein